MKKNITLRKKFIIRIFSILIVIAVVSGATQLYLMNKQIISQTNQQANAIANDVLRGVKQTDEATQSIEQQIDLKLVSYSKNIATLLEGQSPEQITRDELLKISKDLGLAGITIFQENAKKDDIIGTISTDEQEVGFSLKQVGYYDAGKLLLNGNLKSLAGATYFDRNTIVLPIAQSGSHKDKPTFFKYAYFKPESKNYIINPYIKANEIYNYTQNVGPDTTIKQLVKEIDIVKEIAVLNPKVYANPTLEKQLYPPLKKIEAGNFQFQTDRDIKLLSKSVIKKSAYIENVNGSKIYKMFIPLNDNRVIYLALDYKKMSGPLHKHSIILIIFGLISLLALFLLTASFFNKIYEGIHKIKSQILLLEKGDLTAKSHVNDGSELTALSETVNSMVNKWNKIVEGTQNHAIKTQSLATILEADASHSVEKLFEVSTESTITSREQLYEITEFLDEVENVLQSENKESAKVILSKVESMRKIANDRTSATTDITITLSDLLNSLHKQSSELSEISNTLLEKMSKFKL